MHPYKGSKNAGKERVGQILGKKKPPHTDMMTCGGMSKGRMDKYARGGKVKGGAKHHTKINIVVAPKGGDAGGPPGMPPPGGAPPMGPPPGAGGPPPGMPPMPPPKGGMGGPPMGGGMPGMKRGGKVAPKSGISNPKNLKAWSDRASSNSRYERGGKVDMKAGALTGEGRLEKADKYGMKAKKKD